MRGSMRRSRRSLGRGFTSEPISKPIENITPTNVEDFKSLPELAQWYLKAQSKFGYLSHINCGGYIFGATFKRDGYKIWCEKCHKMSKDGVFYPDGVVDLEVEKNESIVIPSECL